MDTGKNPSGAKLNSYSSNNCLSHGGAPVMECACQILEQGEITACRLLYSGSNHVFLVALEREKKEIRAVYKPRRGEAPLWDFPDGTLYKREYATYLVSQALEWHLVPPTVIRTGPYGIGSVQWFVDNNLMVDYESLRTRYHAELKKVALFDYLVNNADRKAGHCLEGRDGRLWMVDHGLTFNTVPKLRTVIWEFSGESIPPKLVSEVAVLRQKLKRDRSLREALSRLLAVSELEALEFRIKRIIENPVYPYPESRRSVPWPWI